MRTVNDLADSQPWFRNMDAHHLKADISLQISLGMQYTVATVLQSCSSEMVEASLLALQVQHG